MCLGCSKEPSHRDDSFEYPQHMFQLRNKKIFFRYVPLSGGLGNILYVSNEKQTSAGSMFGSNTGAK